MLRYRRAFALSRAAKIVRGLRQGLTEDKRRAVAEHVVRQLKARGDPWRLSDEARPGTRADDVSCVQDFFSSKVGPRWSDGNCAALYTPVLLPSNWKIFVSWSGSDGSFIQIDQFLKAARIPPSPP